MICVTFLREKSEALQKLNIFKARVETKTRLKLKCLRSNSGKFTSSEFSAYYEEHGVKRQLSPPRTPQQNGVVERKTRRFNVVYRTMIIEGNVPHIFWTEAVSTVVYTLNQVNVKGDTGKTSYELWFGHAPTIIYFRIFGSTCYIKRDEDLGKFDARCDEGIFLGYSTKSKAYQCYTKILRNMV